MQFLEMQTRFANLHLDSRTEWIVSWNQNKQALNDWYKEVFRKFVDTYTGMVQMKTDKHWPITITEWVGILPNDFYKLSNTEDWEWVFQKVLNWYYHLKEIPYKIIFGTPYKIIFNVTPNNEIYIDYIKNITALIWNTDTPTIPEQLHDSIVDFAIVEYFRQQRDWNNTSASLQYAEWKMQERLNQIWHD